MDYCESSIGSVDIDLWTFDQLVQVCVGLLCRLCRILLHPRLARPKLQGPVRLRFRISLITGERILSRYQLRRRNLNFSSTCLTSISCRA